MDGASIIAKSIRDQGIEYVFGIVGIPIVEISLALQAEDVKYVGMRNEQAASYAASIIGYLTQRPAVCLVVPGPGVIHALAGIVNAQVNCWPLLVIGGSYDQDQVGMGGFQELPQVEAVSRYCKYATRLETLESIPYHIEKAVRTSTYGRPGVCYIDVPGNMITDAISEDKIRFCPRCLDAPFTLADPLAVRKACKVLSDAVRPLVIIGKGAAYAHAEEEIQEFVIRSNLPFLPTPMGKGVISDTHPLCIAAARSKALAGADVILLIGARLNWILHFGRPPRFNPNVKIIQVDICAEEIGNSVPVHVMLNGHIKSVMKQLNEVMKNNPLKVSKSSQWWKDLSQKIGSNTRANQLLAADKSLPMSFYCAYNEICSLLPRNAIIVNEGSSTMDIGRTVLFNELPRHRLDAGTFATMGVGCGFAVAAALLSRDSSTAEKERVVCIQGDSAFGFSGMEFETACRYQLPIIFIVMNNNGIYSGVDKETWEGFLAEKDPTLSIAPTTLLHDAHYEKMALAFGADGYYASTPGELRQSIEKALQQKLKPVLINVSINPVSARRPQESSWLTKTKL
ncbi:2-hydroxyacyl-CoA lyase 1-like [Dysidea avara]|uniref:2-hydroxyacyl-CoA lyase 1-like n=1 Tax=Dysidea avara TaxID=196820 RepID=UPI00332404EE